MLKAVPQQELHEILPDEHTWAITLSYAIGGASGKEGMKVAIPASVYSLKEALVARKLPASKS